MSGFDQPEDPRDANRRERRQGFQRLAALRTGDAKHLAVDLDRQSFSIASAFENLQFEAAFRWNVVFVPFRRYSHEPTGGLPKERQPFMAAIGDALLVVPESNDVPIYLPATAPGALAGAPAFDLGPRALTGGNAPDMAGRSILIIFAVGSGTISVKPAQGEKMNGVVDATDTISAVGKREYLCITNSREHGTGPLDGAGWWAL